MPDPLFSPISSDGIVEFWDLWDGARQSMAVGFQMTFWKTSPASTSTVVLFVRFLFSSASKWPCYGLSVCSRVTFGEVP